MTRPATPRGPLSDWVVSVLGEAPGTTVPPMPPPPAGIDPMVDDDLHLALFLCDELQFGGLDGVDDAWGWDPGLLAGRAALEAPFESVLRAAAARRPAVGAGTIDAQLREIIRTEDGPS